MGEGEAGEVNQMMMKENDMGKQSLKRDCRGEEEEEEEAMDG